MCGLRSVCLGLASAWAVATVAQAGDTVYYAFELDGQRIGHAEIAADDATFDGQPVRSLRTTTVLKFGMLGTTRTITRHATTLVHPDTGLPLHFQLKQDVNGTVNHVECRFADQQVRIWQTDAAAAKGEPQEIAIVPGTRILANNDFAHWGLLAQAMFRQTAKNQAEFTVFLPDTANTESLQLSRGEPVVVRVGESERNCQAWQLAGAGLTILIDAQSGQFVQMNLPAQKTVVRMADASVAEDAAETAVPDVLARHFAQSNVVFDDFLRITSIQLKVEASLIGEAVGQDEATLQTAMQEFAGQRQDSAVSGAFTVRSHTYEPTTPIPFPGSPPSEPALAAYLQPSAMIESDDAAIAAKARELTQGVSQRWEAVARIADWVHREIRYAIGDTPSARLALEKRRGDCGPHATLTVAMLRAVGIPARLVGGLVYAPTFGGTFGQHAWVEVHMGADGWIAFDPTTGEVESLSATHVKLFEGMGGVIPARVEVVAYEPPNRDVPAQTPGAAQTIHWELAKDFTYTYTQGGQRIGTEVFRFDASTGEGQPGLQLTSQLDVTAQGRAVRAETRIETDLRALPRRFARKFDVGGKQTTIECQFAGDTVHVKISGATQMTRDIPFKAGTYCFDNNLIASFALIASQFDLAPNKTIELRTFHPSTLQEIPLTVRVKDVKSLRVAGTDVACFECTVEPIQNTFWITRDNRLVKVDAPGVVIELTK
ncbi:MAG: lasso peptide biosynthesis protein [Pirellulaceae bacterium]|jgi:transglutaminase-like putative cysteine protease|nr:lasso peptide biosynthesis protein [Pirellulaceae bacterium]